MRIFFDANVLFSALTTRGVCFDLLFLCIDEHIVLVSEQVLEEVARVLVRMLHYSQAQANAYVNGYAPKFTICPAHIYEDIPIRDPDDAPIFGAARFAGADVLVTGDKDLLVLNGLTELEVIKPRQLLDRLRGAE